MTTFHSHQHKIISFTKGAPDILLQQCTDVDIAELQNKVDAMASKGQRVLGFAYRYWDSLPDNPDSKHDEFDLHFLGLTGMIDPATGRSAGCRGTVQNGRYSTRNDNRRPSAYRQNNCSTNWNFEQRK